MACVLIRQVGATVGNFLTKPIEKNGLGFGTQDSSLTLFGLLLALLVYDSLRTKQQVVVLEDRLPNTNA